MTKDDRDQRIESLENQIKYIKNELTKLQNITEFDCSDWELKELEKKLQKKYIGKALCIKDHEENITWFTEVEHVEIVDEMVEFTGTGIAYDSLENRVNLEVSDDAYAAIEFYDDICSIISKTVQDSIIQEFDSPEECLRDVINWFDDSISDSYELQRKD